jgi:hypothetical protein
MARPFGYEVVTMQARKLGISHGWLWIKHGLDLIFRNPVLSVVLSAIVATGIFLATKIPFLGPLLALLLLPVLVAGYMRACQAMELHEEAELVHLIAGFKLHTSRLIALGGILLVGVLSITAATVAIGGDTLVSFLEKAQEINDPEIMWAEMQAAGESAALAMLVGMLLLLALSVCLQFAPMLVLFDGENPLVALRSSLMATLRNALPYTVYGLILYLIVLAISMLPFFIALVLLFTISMTSLYAAYRDIFSMRTIGSAAEGVTQTSDEQSHF